MSQDQFQGIPSISLMISRLIIRVSGVCLLVSIFENIFIPAVTGEVMLMDSDGAGFMGEEGIEFLEDFTFQLEMLMMRN